MNRFAIAPLALALTALAACGAQTDATNDGTAASAVAGKAAPAGTTWAQTIVATPEGGLRMGNPDAPIKIIEFGSYTCPHCAEFTEESHEQVERDFVNSGKVSFEYRNYVRDPLDITVALLARCGGPEAFFPLNLQFFQNQEEMIKKIQAGGEGAYQTAIAAPPGQRFVRMATLAGLIDYAKERGIPEDKARQCLADTKTAEMLAAGVERDTAKYSITGTPTILLNETPIDVPTWQAVVERLKAAGA
jgi:protein-disulfide isomerase